MPLPPPDELGLAQHDDVVRALAHRHPARPDDRDELQSGASLYRKD